jgi:class 3 adenylate cyclase
MMQTYHRNVYQCVTVNYGYVAQHLGDGVMAYFGFPTLFQHAPKKAVEAGFGLISEIKKLSNKSMQEYGVALKIRISIHTGTVVMADLGMGNRKERLAMGGTPNIAARLQSAAPENGIAVSEETYQQTQEYFDYEKLGSFLFKGVLKEMNVYQPLGWKEE